MEWFHDGSYCATGARENSLGAPAGAAARSARGNGAIQAVLPGQPDQPCREQSRVPGCLTPQEWYRHPAWDMMPHVLLPPSSRCHTEHKHKELSMDKTRKFIYFFFFSRFLKVHQVHHSFLSCLCSLKHNRPLTSAVPHNVTIMNKWQINDSREKTHLSHRKEILFLQSNSSPEMLIK